MTTVWLNIILKLLRLINETDVFLVERAALCRQINPTLLALIESFVGDVDGSNLSGAQKKDAVLLRVANATGEIGAMVQAASGALINKAIEYAVTRLRSA